jgi:hypothetical protein
MHPSVVDTMALAVLTLFGMFLIALGLAAHFTRQRAIGFLSGFAQTPAKHYLELAVRALVASAFLQIAPKVGHTHLLAGIGWILLGTTIVLAVVPWRVHQRFAASAVPKAAQFISVIGVFALAAGSALIGFVGHLVMAM